jgi:transcriptional regulator with XRE-family HTH domain
MSQKKTGEADQRIGERIRAFRLLRGMSQEGLAERLGVTFQQVQKYEKGANRISASRLIHAAEVLEVSLDQLTGRSSEHPGRSAILDAALDGADAARLLRAYRVIENPVAKRALVDIAQLLASGCATVPMLDAGAMFGQGEPARG